MPHWAGLHVIWTLISIMIHIEHGNEIMMADNCSIGRKSTQDNLMLSAHKVIAY